MVRILSAGTVFAGYRIIRVLGSGGMGVVYLAEHPRLPRADALKVLAAGDEPEFRARFAREADVLARLDHPNIVAIRDRGVEDDSQWIAMQFVDGEDAAQLIARHPSGIAPESAVRIVTDAARGLDEAHRAGVLHRDVKPANILLESRPDGPPRVYVTDFGIAGTAAESTVLTDTGTVLVTLAYAAPEQFTGVARDHRADVYALGCTLFELLTGAKPYPHADVVRIMRAHLTDPPPRPSAHNPALPAALDEVIACALAKRPDSRYRSCGELAAAAAAAFDTPNVVATVAHRPAPVPAIDRPRRRRAVRTPVVLAVVVALALAGVGWFGFAGRTAHSGPSAAAPTTAASPVPTVTSSGQAGLTWGAYAFIVAAFPKLLPVSPAAGGYQGIRCQVVDKEWKMLDPTVRPESLATIFCRGDKNPLNTLAVICNTSRTPTSLRGYLGQVQLGDTRWQRGADSGRIVWGNEPIDDSDMGSLEVGFDDPARNFCYLSAFGGANGQELVDRWWRDVPL
ncbi:serine/threonine-protein kinase [Nocardia sp. NPDC056000]|uniref:serine/threonine-protein kinase n=1 Tax=Nocardia sp. NPDC056000 TaxID=3345674 RepID=UPI0035D6D8C5